MDDSSEVAPANQSLDEEHHLIVLQLGRPMLLQETRFIDSSPINNMRFCL